jgi:bacterial/archaeal transporter family protein
MPMWLLLAMGSAVFAALVGVLGKVGLKEVDPTLATAVRSVVMSAMLVAVALAVGVAGKVSSISKQAMMMIALAGVAGALSWLCYFHAVKLGEVSKVAPIDKLSMPLAVILAVIFLSERPGTANWIGVVLMVIGAVLVALPAGK